MHLTTRAVGTVAAFTLSLSALAAPAVASSGPDGSSMPEACAQQQKQVDKAESALERLSAVFERQQAKVKKEKEEKKNADTANERRLAKRDVAKAKDDRSEAKENRKAQQQRLAKASERLEQCQAEQTEPPAEPAEA